jgi:hypothetical protein
VSQRPDKSTNQATVIVNGERRTYQFNPELLQALEALQPADTGILMKILSKPAEIMKFGATGASPEFIFRNPLRDMQDALMQSRNGFLPILDTVYGAWANLFDKDLVNEWSKAGGGSAGLAPMTREALRSQLDAMHMNPMQYVVRHPMEIFSLTGMALRAPGEFTERATRLGEYRLARKKGKTDLEAALDSRDVTLDFSRQGTATRSLNMIIPFFSAAINANDRFMELHNPRNPKVLARTVTRGLMGFTIPSIILWALNHDDDEYKELEPWRKNLFWNIPTKHLPAGDSLRSVFGPFIPIPRAHLYGLVYGNLPERLMEKFYADNPKAFKGFFDDINSSAVPDIIPAIARPAFEARSNYSFFTGRAIESRSQQAVSPRYRMNPGTSEAAKAISRTMKMMDYEVSPIMVDHLFMGYTAGLGRAALTVTESMLGLRGGRAEMASSDTPFLRAFATPQSPSQPESVTELYDRQQELERKKANFKLRSKYKAGPAQDAEGLTSQEASELKRYQAAARQLSELYAETLRTQYDSGLSPKEKRAKIDEINAKRPGIARAALGK